VLSKTQQNESGLSQHKQGSLISMSDRLLESFAHRPDTRYNSVHRLTFYLS